MYTNAHTLIYKRTYTYIQAYMHACMHHVLVCANVDSKGGERGWGRGVWEGGGWGGGGRSGPLKARWRGLVYEALS
jgi:hypothetical protein